MGRPPAVARARAPRWLIGAALAYALFVVYGSMVPLDYHPRPISEAWDAFLHMQENPDGALLSRTDWAANLVLLVPLPFLWLSLWSPRSRRNAVALSALTWVLCLLFSLGVEFGQIFFPPRNPSVRDIVAQAIGSAAGIASWWVWGADFRLALERWRTASGPERVAQAILWPYLVVLFLYNVMPLDLTVSPAAIFQKWKEGRIVLAPFGHPDADMASRLFGLAVDILVWIPVAALVVVSGKKRASHAWIFPVVAATVLEGAQLLVFTRVADVTDILTAMVGGGIGAWAGAGLRSRAGVTVESQPSRSPVSWIIAGMAGAFLWLFVLAALFWYPFDFRIERSFAMGRLPMLRSVPFQAYWTGSEFLALSGVFNKVLFFVPLGAALALACGAHRSPRARAAARIGAAALITAAAFGVELGQVFLPSKVPDSTDVLLEAAGGFLGLWLVPALRSRLGRRGAHSEP